MISLLSHQQSSHASPCPMALSPVPVLSRMLSKHICLCMCLLPLRAEARFHLTLVQSLAEWSRGVGTHYVFAERMDKWDTEPHFTDGPKWCTSREQITKGVFPELFRNAAGGFCTEPGAEDKWCRRIMCWQLAASMGFGPEDPGSEPLAPPLPPINGLTSLSLVSSSVRSLALLY